MNLNKAIIVGNITQDPEVRSTPSGDQVANFSVATNRFWTDKSGQKQQKAEFHNVVAWRRLADIVSQYTQKGSLILVEGRIETRSWEGQDGKRNYKTEIIADNIQLGPRNNGGGDSGNGGNNQSASAKSSGDTKEEDLPTVDVDSNSDDEVDVKDIPF